MDKLTQLQLLKHPSLTAVLQMLRPVRLVFIVTGMVTWSTFAVAMPDPFAANNTLYPPVGDAPGKWNGEFRTSNYDYPIKPAKPDWRPKGLVAGPLTTKTAKKYVDFIKKHIQKDMSGLVNSPLTWSPEKAGWYSMPWGAQGSTQANGKIDPESGREALLGSYTGQILQPNTFSPPTPLPPKAFQNHAVIYYNPAAASMLAEVWKDPFEPDVSAAQFPEGSIVVKVEAATLTPQQWPPLAGSSLSFVYRPTTQSLLDTSKSEKTAEIVPVYFTQMAIKVKDSIASPETGWVFIAFAYDTNKDKGVAGVTVWDKAVAVGAMWGNDPEYSHNPKGHNPDGKPLIQTWLNPDAPQYSRDVLGWGGRLSGPMDVGRRHNVITVSGQHYQKDKQFAASSCLSCHGAAQYPFIANLYPSPNLVFPEDGNQFLFFDPGSEQWAEWFQNRPGKIAMSGAGRVGITAIDYDLLLTFALTAAKAPAATGKKAFIPNRLHGH